MINNIKNTIWNQSKNKNISIDYNTKFFIYHHIDYIALNIPNCFLSNKLLVQYKILKKLNKQIII